MKLSYTGLELDRLGSDSSS